MAVRIDLDAVRGVVDPGVFRDAEELLTAGRLDEITPMGGGAFSVVEDGGGALLEVWVGVVEGAFAVECDCADPDGDLDELCVHAVALTIAALQDGFSWLPTATPPSLSDIDSADDE